MSGFCSDDWYNHLMWRSKIEDLAAAQSAKALSDNAATSMALRAHMDECGRRAIEADRKADVRDERQRSEAAGWRGGLGERLDHQDEAIGRIQRMLVGAAGTAFLLVLGLVGWLAAVLLSEHG